MGKPRKFRHMFARAAYRDITPRDRPVRLAGYASRHEPVSAILDPIEISALLLECDERRFLIFSFDLMMVGSDLQKVILATLEKYGFQPRDVMMLASHTHCAPATDSACARLGRPDVEFIGEAAEAAERLVREILQARPSKVNLDVFCGRLDHSVNRRRYWPIPTYDTTQGLQWAKVTFSPYRDGPRDERVTTMLLRTRDTGKPLAVIWHYTCHPAGAPIANISADYPGAVRIMLRERFGDIPCLFALGFCGDITSHIVPTHQTQSPVERFRKFLRMAVAGYMVPTVTPADWFTWSRSLVTRVAATVTSDPIKTLFPDRLRSGLGTIALNRFFSGSFPDKMLVAQIVRIGNELEIIALSAEPTVEWQGILDEIAPAAPQRMRLYVGYLGAVFGYLPTPAQSAEGGYEVNGFQSLFGLSGRFESEKIVPAVAECVNSALEKLESAADGVPEPERSEIGR